MINLPLQSKLLQMVKEDRRVRAELAATGELFDGYAPRMAQVHARNAAALETILDEFGFPGDALVGEQGQHAAWFIVQHAIGSPALQRRYLSLLKQAVAAHQAEPAQVAYLEDRICFFERRPQRYGTQFDWDEQGQMSPWTLQDPARVDEYRHAVGLEPLGDKIAQVRQELKAKAPPNFRQRQEEMETWAKSVGWF